MTDDDIRAFFEMDGSAVVWKEISVAGLNALFRRAAAKHNMRAGTVVEFWSGYNGQPMVTAAGEQVTRSRIEKVLLNVVKVKKRKAPQVPRSKAAIARETPEQREARIAAEVLEADRVRAVKVALGFEPNVKGVWSKADGTSWNAAMLHSEDGKAASEAWMQKKEHVDG